MMQTRLHCHVVFVARPAVSYDCSNISELLTLYSNLLSRAAMGPLCPARFNPAMPILTTISEARMMSGTTGMHTLRFMGPQLPGMVEKRSFSPPKALPPRNTLTGRRK
jgi:hypothetical protein